MLDKLQGRIRFEDVTFGYSDDGEPSVSKVNMDIAAGEFVAVVGPTGSGKSTLIKLLLGFYPPSEGRVLVDGHDLRQLCLTTLRRRIGVVPQEVFLFSGTIAENIAMGASNMDPSRVIEAARLAGAHEFIAKLDLGYGTMVGDRGLSLSGGQRQLIALARALCPDPDVLVLDEPTSALDQETERAFQKQLRLAARVRTTIVVAHRLSTIREADRILVMNKGHIVEAGTHCELSNRGTIYSRLVDDGQDWDQFQSATPLQVGAW